MINILWVKSKSERGQASNGTYSEPFIGCVAALNEVQQRNLIVSVRAEQIDKIFCLLVVESPIHIVRELDGTMLRFCKQRQKKERTPRGEQISNPLTAPMTSKCKTEDPGEN